MENADYFTKFSMAFKCKELGLFLDSKDYDVDEINGMFMVLEFNNEKAKRKADNGRKTRV